MDPFHGIGGRERQDPGEHFIQGDAERIEIAAGVDRAVHAAGLLGRDVGKCPGDAFGRRGRLALARQPRRNAESGKPDIVGGVDEHIRGLDVLVNETTPMDMADDGREVDGDAQELNQLQPLIEKAIEWLAAIVLQHKGSGSLFADQRQRQRRPAGIELVRQRVFVLEPLDECRPTGDKRQHRHGIVGLPGAMQRKLPIVSQRL